MHFSIITPSFRQLDWLELCAASIADQDIELEHIVQDAGSTGIEAWAANHPDVRVFVEKDNGMYDAVNRGLRRATGDICAYLNCDEQYLPGTLQRVAGFFAAHPEIDILFGDVILADPDMAPLSYRRVIMPTRSHLLLRPLGVLTAATFFRRKLVADGMFFDPAWKDVGDKAWVYELLGHGYRMAVYPEPLSVFALTGANMSTGPNAKKENARWSRQATPALRVLKPAIVGWHLLCKWLHGAYVKRTPKAAWYTRKSFPSRQNFTGQTLGWDWPLLTSQNADALAVK